MKEIYAKLKWEGDENNYQNLPQSSAEADLDKHSEQDTRRTDAEENGDQRGLSKSKTDECDDADDDVKQEQMKNCEKKKIVRKKGNKDGEYR